MSDETKTQTDPTAQAEATTSAGTQNAGKEDAEAQSEKTVPYERFQEVNRRAKEAEKKLAEMGAAQTAAEQQSLTEQGKFKELAEKASKRVAELEPLAETVKRQGEALSKFLEGERKGLPKHILALLDKLDPVDQLEYIATNRNELRPAGGPNPTPKAEGELGKLSDEERRKKAYVPRF